MVKILLFLVVISNDTLYLSESGAYNLAIKNSPQVKSSMFNVFATKYEKNAQFSSFLPQVSFSGTYTRLSLQQTMKMFQMDSLVMTPSGNFIPMGHFEEIPFSQKDNYNLGLNAQQVLFTFGKLLYSYKAADYKLKSAQVNDTITKGFVGITVRELYTQSLLARYFYELAMSIDSELKNVYEITKNKYKNGTATEIELLQAKLNYKQQRQNVLEAENSYNSALSMLKVILGIPSSVNVVLTDSITPLGKLDTIEQNFLDIKNTELTIKQLELQKKVIDRLNFPTLFAGFSYSYQKPFGMENQWKGYWAVSLGFSWPLFDGFKSVNQAKSLNNTIKSLRVMYNMQKSQRLIDIENKKRELKIAQEQLDVAKENRELAEKLYRSSEIQYKEGFMNYTDFSNIIVMYRSSRLNELSALANLKLKQLEYVKYMKGFILNSQGNAQSNMSQNMGGMESKTDKNATQNSSMNRNKKGGF